MNKLNLGMRLPVQAALIFALAALCLTIAAAPRADAAPPNGTYKGKAGTTGRVSFKLKGKKIRSLKAATAANCQRSSDGAITQNVVLAFQPKGKIKVKPNGKFKASGQEDDTGVAWKFSGKVKSNGKAKGKLEASRFSTIYNPFAPGGFDGELCSGSNKWKTKKK